MSGYGKGLGPKRRESRGPAAFVLLTLLSRT